MKKLILFLFTSILFAISVQAQVGPEQARNYQINEAHTGAINVPGLEPPLKQKWSRNFGQNLSYPLIADGKVYVTVRYATVFGTELYALNAADGATLWSSPLGGSASWSASCYENGRVFALNNSGLLRAFDGETGNVILEPAAFRHKFHLSAYCISGCDLHRWLGQRHCARGERRNRQRALVEESWRR